VRDTSPHDGIFIVLNILYFEIEQPIHGGGPVSTVDPSLSNRDLRPTGPEQRTWGFYNYMALWFSMCMEITTYRLASGLIANGMDWKQALGTVLLGNLIVLVPCC
jgi:cytosine/uracil/thiamine/allantoin permease